MPHPLIPLPDEMLLLPIPIPMQPQSSPERQSPGESLSSVDSSPLDLSREGPFDAYCESSDAGSHPLISTGLPGCPYRMTSYRLEDVADVDPAFGVQLHHPRFLECIGAPESARLLGCSPAEWVWMMYRQDVIAAVLQLQRDAGLMASNLQVLDQYVMSLNRMSSEVLHLAFGPEVFPAHAVNVATRCPGCTTRPTRWQP